MIKRTSCAVLVAFCFLASCGQEESVRSSADTSRGWGGSENTSPTVTSYPAPAAKVSAFATTASAVVNGGFESGFAGWTTEAIGFGINGNTSVAWITGGSDPNGSDFGIYYGDMPHTESLAHSGSSGVSAVENGSTYHAIYQDVTIPASGGDLEYWIRWKNQQGSWIAPNGTGPNAGQDILVTISDPGTGTVLATLFQASAANAPLFSGGGDFYEAHFEQHTFDLSAFAGQTVRLKFENYVCCYFQYMDLDDVRIGTSDPADKDACKNGGWEAFGFKNQGQCVRFVETGKDSR